jgi:hypothetical protein
VLAARVSPVVSLEVLFYESSISSDVCIERSQKPPVPCVNTTKRDWHQFLEHFESCTPYVGHASFSGVLVKIRTCATDCKLNSSSKGVVGYQLAASRFASVCVQEKP